jgi:hypothetical protein
VYKYKFIEHGLKKKKKKEEEEEEEEEEDLANDVNVLFLFSSRQLSLGYNFAFPFNSHIKATVLRLATAGFIMLPKLPRLKNILYKCVHLYCFDIYMSYF